MKPRALLRSPSSPRGLRSPRGPISLGLSRPIIPSGPKILLPLLLFLPLHILADSFLFSGGKSNYTIVLSEDASQSEKTAADELRHYIRQISGARLPVVVGRADSTNHIFVGWNEACGSPRPDNGDEGFTYRTVDNDLHIFGGSDRGTMYGVFAFLEQELGVRWYTAKYTKVPALASYPLPHLDHSEKPALRQRLDFCYEALRNLAWSAHNRMNTMHTLLNNKYGSFSAYWGAHTFQKLIPPEKYFADHPEYFSLYKGKRSDKAQLCLSNEEMRRELVKNLKEAIEANPGFWCYDVSQNDNRDDCQCPDCQQLVSDYGGRSGAMLWFVNEVAREIRQPSTATVPEASASVTPQPSPLIGTFAYQTTRHAPTVSLQIEPNVVIRLCDIECCMAHPITSCPQNNSFLDDLQNWQRLTPNVYIWNYSTCFRRYLLPFPCFRALAANYRHFAEANVIGVMEEGAHDAPWSEFSELKQWMIAKLLWNPWQDTDSLAAEFIDDYYGAAAPFVRQYYDLCQRRADDCHFTVTIDGDSPLYDSPFTDHALRLLEQAMAASVGTGPVPARSATVPEVSPEGTVSDQTLKRTKRLAAQIYFLKLRRDYKAAVADGTRQKLIDIIAADSTIVRESGYTLQSVLSQMEKE